MEATWVQGPSGKGWRGSPPSAALMPLLVRAPQLGGQAAWAQVQALSLTTHQERSRLHLSFSIYLPTGWRHLPTQGRMARATRS